MKTKIIIRPKNHSHTPPLQRVLFNTPVLNPNPFKSFYDQFTFQNQHQFANDISNAFLDLHILNVLAIAPTQSGKTGSMLSICYQFLNNPTLNVPFQNIFIITAHSSREWLLQTRQRFPSFMHNNIFHRNTLHIFQKRTLNLKNIIVIVDEAHIASKIGQSLHSLYKSLNFYDLKHLYNSNIKLIHFTATPEFLEKDLSRYWKFSSKTIHMDVPNSYMSHEKLQQQSLLFPMKDLTKFDFQNFTYDSQTLLNIQELLPHIFTFKTPKFHIIRTPRSSKHFITIHNFRFAFRNQDFNLISELFIHDFDDLLLSTPNKHTFIFIKDKFRCAKTFHHSNIGILYERFVHKPNHSTILQSLYGRATGFHFHKHIVFSTYFAINHKYALSFLSF